VANKSIAMMQRRTLVLPVHLKPFTYFLPPARLSTKVSAVLLLIMNLERTRIRLDVLCPQLLHHRFHLMQATVVATIAVVP